MSEAPPIKRPLISSKRTFQFVDLGFYICLFAVVVILLASLGSLAFQRTVYSKTVNVATGEPEELLTATIQPEMVGALRLDVEALIPYNQWVTYELQIRDREGQVLASAMKEAWAETGIWREDGETGTWREKDVQGGLDVQAAQAEPVTLVLSVLDYTDTRGQEIDQPVPFRVSIKKGAVDRRYLLIGLILTSVLTVLAALSVPLSGRPVLRKRVPDSVASDRTVMGGKNKLLRVQTAIKADENTPRQLSLLLSIRDAYGNTAYQQTINVKMGLNKETDVARGRTTQFFVLEPRNSYGISVDVRPDDPVDATTLTIREGSHTLVPVDVVFVKCN